VDTPHEPERGRIIAFPHPAPDDARDDDRVIAREPARAEAAAVSHLRALPLGLSSGAFYPHLPTEEAPDRAAALGVTTVELMLQTAGEYDPAFVADLAARARDAGVTVRSVHTLHRLHPLSDPYARRAREGRELFQRGIEAAAALGAEVLVWHGPRGGEVREQAGWDRFVATTGELAAACGAAGVTLGLENVSWCALATVRDVVRMAATMEEIAPAAQLGFVFDPFQAMRAAANPFMILAAMGNRLVNVHISDFSEDEPERHHLPPGEGTIPWSALLRAIAGSGYRGPMILESPLTEGAATLDAVRDYLEPRIRSIFDHAPDAATRQPPPLPEPTTMPDGLREGIALFNRGRFYDAHEVIEHEWHAERGPIRRLYQGILQIGVGFHHALSGNHKGALLLLGDGIDKTAGFMPETLGIDTERLVAEAGACREAIAALGPDGLDRFDRATIPTIHGPAIDADAGGTDP
jgi:sugar phosphate isomerase/epimerase